MGRRGGVLLYSLKVSVLVIKLRVTYGISWILVPSLDMRYREIKPQRFRIWLDCEGTALDDVQYASTPY